MRPSLVISLLLLSLLLTNVQGIRLDKGSVVVQHKKHHEEESALLKRSDSTGVEEAILCKEGQCIGKIKTRKFVTTPISTAQAVPKNVKNGGNQAQSSVNGNTRNVKVDEKEVGMKVNTSSNSEHRELPHEQYPDLLDIAEMDYSPAKRKPPIHN